MLGAKLLLVMLMGQVSAEQADPGTLIPRLGASRFAEREAASMALERLGRSALPALRAARQSRDAEVRNRVSGVLHKIEGSLLTQATRVRLDFEHAPLTDVVRSLSQQAGFKVALYPDTLPKWKYTKVTLREPQPVPFWKAVDLLCDTAVLQQYPALHGIAGPREPTFALTDGTSRVLTPNFDHGPFRVSVLGIHDQRDLNYGPARSGGIGGGGPQKGDLRPARRSNPARDGLHPVISVQFAALLQVAAEPRLCVSSLNGTIQVIEVVDDRGNSLAGRAAVRPPVNRYADYFSGTPGSVVQLQAPLHRPIATGETIKRFRGSIPLSISSRRPDPLIVRLDQGLGKQFANADVEITVHDIRPMPNFPQTLLELSIKVNERPSPAAESGESDVFGDVYRGENHRQQLEIYDSRGQLARWYPSGVNSETSRSILTVTNLPANVSLKELRYYTLNRASVNVPFEFTDIPLP